MKKEQSPKWTSVCVCVCVCVWCVSTHTHTHTHICIRNGQVIVYRVSLSLSLFLSIPIRFYDRVQTRARRETKEHTKLVGETLERRFVEQQQQQQQQQQKKNFEFRFPADARFVISETKMKRNRTRNPFHRQYHRNVSKSSRRLLGFTEFFFFYSRLSRFPMKRETMGTKKSFFKKKSNVIDHNALCR